MTNGDKIRPISDEEIEELTECNNCEFNDCEDCDWQEECCLECDESNCCKNTCYIKKCFEYWNDRTIDELIEELDKEDTIVNTAIADRLKILQGEVEKLTKERDEIKRELNHAIYERDVARTQRNIAERELDIYKNY